MNKHRTQIVGAAALLAAASAIVVPALATPGSGFTPTPLSKGLLEAVESRARDGKWEARLRTKEGSDVTVDRLTVIDGGQSGWHTHAGITILTVTAGEVVWYDGGSPGCPSKTYRVGDTFVEPANNVHLVHNTSGATAEFVGMQIRTVGAPGRIDAAQPTGADCPVF